MESKIMTAKQAVERFIHPGCHIAFGGFTILRRPMAIAREIVRQNIGELFVTMNGGTIVEEMLAGAGLIKWLETTYLGMDGGMPVAYAVRRGIELGEIELVEDYSNWSFAQRTLAGRLGLPFMPCMATWAPTCSPTTFSGRPGCGGRRRTAPPCTRASPAKSSRSSTTPLRGTACAGGL